MAFGTPDTAPCAQAAPAAISASANAAVPKLREENIISRSFRMGRFAGNRSRLRRRRRRFRCSGFVGGLTGRALVTELVQVHHDIAFEPHDLTAVENSEFVGGERSVEQFDVDMFIRR